jgi:proteasome assembly chaperone (PAC2) family protein
MAESPQLIHPWLVAVWPGMGNVALNAGIYLLAKLNMTMIAEVAVNELFDIEHVEVKQGLVQLGRRPRNRFFVWKDPHQRHDLVVFLGEAQPPIGRYAFCKQLVTYAQQLGIERVFTFAAMATQMHPEHASSVFVAATDQETLDELQGIELVLLEDGNIGGLNGVLLGVAKEAEMHGACLLGEMPQIFSQLPFPKASLAILQIFTSLAGIEMDFAELQEQAGAMEEQLGELFERVQEAYGKQFGEQEQDEEESFKPEPMEEDQVSPQDRRKIEQLFEEATQNRAKAFELKQVLDRLEVFKEYEDRFLDLFKKTE